MIDDDRVQVVPEEFERVLRALPADVAASLADLIALMRRLHDREQMRQGLAKEKE